MRKSSDEERRAARERRQGEKERLAAEKKQAAESERARKQALRSERAARRNATTSLPWLGVAVRDGSVYKNDFAVVTGREEGRHLGNLAGAHAEVTGGRAGHRRSGGARTADAVAATAVLGPVGLLAGANRKGVRGTAFVVFADGKVHEKKINDQSSLVKAQADAVRFNALASASSGQVPEGVRPADDAPHDDAAMKTGRPPSPVSREPGEYPSEQPSAATRLTDELGRLADLHTSGALTDAEFQAAKAELIRTLTD
jgi:Short C-terminal domain